MRIGDVAARSGVSARMLRHYDALGLVRPSDRSVAGYREYAEADIRRIFHVESLRSLGLSLKEIGRALDDPGFEPAQLVDRLIERTRAQIAMQRTLLDRLEHVAETGPGAWDQVLDVVALLSDLKAPSAGVRQHAALGAVDRGAPGDALADALLREENLNVAGALRWALTQADGAGVPILVAGLGSDDAVVRRRAIEALAELPTGDALRAALGHPDPDIRAVAAVELGNRGEAAAVEELVRMVIGGTGDVPAAEALGAVATDHTAANEIAATLISAFDDAAGYEVRQRLVQALAEIPGAAAAAALHTLRDDPDPRIAGTAAYIVGRAAEGDPTSS